MEPYVATIGMLDGVHRGHQWLLGRVAALAAERGMRSMAVTFANHPMSIVDPEAAPGLIQDRESRRQAILATGIDRVEMLNFDHDLRRLTAAEFLNLLAQRYGVKVLVVGFNNRFGSDRHLTFADYQALGEKVGVEVIVAEEYPDATISSTTIRRALAEGNICEANRLLGHPYAIRGTVGHGKQIGRTIGFPTANITPLSGDLLLPLPGAYAAKAIMVDGTSHPAMLNVGRRPTVDSDTSPTIEAHIIGFEGDLYGHTIAIEPLQYLRAQTAFPSLDALRNQLTIDARQSSLIYAEKNHL